MSDDLKSRPQLIQELVAARDRLAILEQSENQYLRLAGEARYEQRRSDLQLEESEEKLRMLAEHINTVFWLMDAAGEKMLYVSPAYEKAWGRTCQSLYDNVQSFLEAVHPADREKATHIFQQQILKGHVDGEYRLLHPDGSVRWTWIRGYPVRNAAGTVTHNVGICEDITERKEHELASSRLAAIVESTEDAIVSMSLEGIAITWNHGAEKLYGYTAEEMIGRSVSVLIPSDRQQEYRELMARVKLKERIANFEAVRQRKDGTLIEVSTSITPIAIRSGAINSSSKISHDITKIKQLERQYLQAQKMEAIGTLAGGVAHDFNNLLTVINGYCGLLLNFPALDDKSRVMVDEIHKAGERAAMLTRQLLAFSRQQMLEPQVLDLNDVVTDTESMLRRLIGEDIVISLSLEPSMRRIKADPGQIQQILMNLVVNARDAMPQGGTLSIETKNVTLDEEYCQSHSGACPGEFAMLAVIDEGTGMDDQTRAHIFEPFYTTKEFGKGTGLGLAMVFGITKQSGGYIHVDSEIGRGTSFEVYFPVSTLDDSHPQRHELTVTPKGHETLLLVEDDNAVRVLANHILQSCGYQVLEAAGGQQAIRLAESHRGPLDLLVSDVVMPHLSGRQLAEQLAALQPRMKVLFLSGYTDDSVIRHGVMQADFAFLQKPFTLASLSSKVRDVLDKS